MIELLDDALRPRAPGHSVPDAGILEQGAQLALVDRAVVVGVVVLERLPEAIQQLLDPAPTKPLLTIETNRK